MNLSRSTYYYQIKNRKKAFEREKKDPDIKDLIDDIHTDFPYYGYRLLHEELKRKGHNVNTKEDTPTSTKIWSFFYSFKKVCKDYRFETFS